MDGYKDFTGKSLDEAIYEACSYYNASRDHLEIDIIQDAKSGIFGLVGVQKAKIRAKKVELRSAIDTILACPQDGANDEETHGRREKAPRTREKKPLKHASKGRERRQPRHHADESEAVTFPAPKQRDLHEDEPQSTAPKNLKGRKTRRPRHEQSEQQTSTHLTNGIVDDEQLKAMSPVLSAELSAELAAELPSPLSGSTPFAEDMDEGDNWQPVPFDSLDKARLQIVSMEVVGQLILPVVGFVPLTADIHEGRICVRMDCGYDSGLLIGREGQTLAALQYLASRIVSRQMQAAVRVQLDAGDYRSRQDEKLKDIALSLAERTKNSGKPFSTRPLSSYHRRIVHMTLQDDPEVTTRSSGEGALKRVIIQRKRS